MSSAWKKYQDQSRATTNPGKLTMMCYEKCLKNLETAKQKVEEFHFAEAEERLVNTRQILYELVMQLNPDADEELSNNLYKLYYWCLHELEIMIMTKDMRKADSVSKVIQDLFDGYKGALEGGQA